MIHHCPHIHILFQPQAQQKIGHSAKHSKGHGHANMWLPSCVFLSGLFWAGHIWPQSRTNRILTHHKDDYGIFTHHKDDYVLTGTVYDHSVHLFSGCKQTYEGNCVVSVCMGFPTHHVKQKCFYCRVRLSAYIWATLYACCIVACIYIMHGSHTSTQTIVIP